MSDNRAPVRLLVIDDEAERLDEYLKFIQLLGEHRLANGELLFPHVAFEPRIAHDEATAHRELDTVKGARAICLQDVKLAGKWSESHVSEIDKLINKIGIPLMLISGYYPEARTTGRVNLISRQRGFTPPLIQWDDIRRAAKDNAIANEFAVELQLYMGPLLGIDTGFFIGPKDSISVMHITDLHHGKADFSKTGSFQILTAMRQNGLGSIDFLAVTGDITDQGQPEQFEEAETTLASLSGGGLFRSDLLARNRLLLCPGNHDVNRALALSSRVHGSDEDGYGICDDVKYPKLWEYGFDPFNGFCSRVTGRHGAWMPIPGYRYIKDFALSGLHFIEVNVETFAFADYPALVSAKDFNKIKVGILDELKDASEGDCVMFLSHRFNPGEVSWLKELITTLAAKHPIVILTGHHHTESIEPIRSKPPCLVIGGTCLGDGNDMADKARPGVRYLKLNRSKGKVGSIERHLLECDETSWSHTGFVEFKSSFPTTGSGTKCYEWSKV